MKGHDGAHNEPTSTHRVDKAYSSKIQQTHRGKHHTTKRNRITLNTNNATLRDAMKTLYGERKHEDIVSTDIVSPFVHVQYKMEPAQW